MITKDSRQLLIPGAESAALVVPAGMLELSDAMTYALQINSWGERTRRTYRQQWQRWGMWSMQVQQQPLPITAPHLCEHLGGSRRIVAAGRRSRERGSEVVREPEPGTGRDGTAPAELDRLVEAGGEDSRPGAQARHFGGQL